jgi:crotonobetainyl-CoA:carnitine CoA-transferase CaiB-like acyl-CoA transferase
MSAGLYAALGILTALLEREVSGKGQWLHVSLLHSQIAMMDFQAARYLNEQDVPVQVGNDHPTSSPMGLFECSDGVFNLGASGEGNWLRLCKLLERDDWLADPALQTEPLRVKNRAPLTAALADIFKQKTVAQWVDALNAAGVPAGPVYTVPQMFEDEQVKHLGVTTSLMTNFGKEMHYITQPVTLERTPSKVVAPAPDWGEHTDEVLLEAGYSAEEIRQFHIDSVV